MSYIFLHTAQFPTFYSIICYLGAGNTLPALLKLDHLPHFWKLGTRLPPPRTFMQTLPQASSGSSLDALCV